MDEVKSLASQKAVVIFSKSSCCMCHSINSLFSDLGVNPTVYELDKEPQGKNMERAIAKMRDRTPSVPVVFIGGKLIGSADEIMALHLGNELVPLLQDAGAIWL